MSELSLRIGVRKFLTTCCTELMAVRIRSAVLRCKNTDLPRLDVKFKNNFEGDGEYERRDDFTARLTAEVVEVLPNGNLILESRTWIKTDEEESLLKLTGICRPEDVTPGNSILSNQLHDLKIEKIHTGELKKTNQKGILTKIFETIFAF